MVLTGSHGARSGRRYLRARSVGRVGGGGGGSRKVLREILRSSLAPMMERWQRLGKVISVWRLMELKEYVISPDNDRVSSPVESMTFFSPTADPLF